MFSGGSHSIQGLSVVLRRLSCESLRGRSLLAIILYFFLGIVVSVSFGGFHGVRFSLRWVDANLGGCTKVSLIIWGEWMLSFFYSYPSSSLPNIIRAGV